jgi:hypothetical protein
MGQVWPVRGIGRVSVGPVLGIGRKRAQIYENIIFTIIAARPPNSVRYLLHLRPIQPILFAIYYTCGPSTQFRSLCTAFAACLPNSVRYLLHLRPIQPIQFAIYHTCGSILRYIIVCYGILCEQQSVGLRRGWNINPRGIGRGAETGMGQVWPVRGIGRVSVGPVLGIGRKRAQI